MLPAASDATAIRKIRILIADDHPTIRQAVRSTLEDYAAFEVCGEAADGAQAIEQARRLKPDVIILNITMPVLNGFEAARDIKATLPGTAIVILSANADRQFVQEARRLGAHAFVAKTHAGEVLIKAIEAAVSGSDFVVMN